MTEINLQYFFVGDAKEFNGKEVFSFTPNDSGLIPQVGDHVSFGIDGQPKIFVVKKRCFTLVSKDSTDVILALDNGSMD